MFHVKQIKKQGIEGKDNSGYYANEGVFGVSWWEYNLLCLIVNHILDCK